MTYRSGDGERRDFSTLNEAAVAGCEAAAAKFERRANQ
jgi:hypothetical protein